MGDSFSAREPGCQGRCGEDDERYCQTMDKAQPGQRNCQSVQFVTVVMVGACQGLIHLHRKGRQEKSAALYHAEVRAARRRLAWRTCAGVN